MNKEGAVENRWENKINIRGQGDQRRRTYTREIGTEVKIDKAFLGCTGKKGDVQKLKKDTRGKEN